MKEKKYDEKLIELIAKINTKYSYLIYRSFCVCKGISKLDISEKKLFIKNLNTYYTTFSNLKIENNLLVGFDVLKNDLEIQHLLLNQEPENIQENTLSDFLYSRFKKIPTIYEEKYLYIENNESAEPIEDLSKILNEIVKIIYKYDFKHGQLLITFFEEIDLNYIFLLDTNLKSKFKISNYFILNIINYFNLFIDISKNIFNYDYDFLYKFMVICFSDKKKNYNILRQYLTSGKQFSHNMKKDVSLFLKNGFSRGFLRTKNQYYIKMGLNDNSKLRTFALSDTNDILNQIKKISCKLSQESILNIYYLSLKNDKELADEEIQKINRLAEDIACSIPNSIVISNSVGFVEQNLIELYISNLKERIDKNKSMNYSDFVIYNQNKNSYMTFSFEGKISYLKKNYNIYIKKSKDEIYMYLKNENKTLFKDRIFTADDSNRVLEYIKYDNQYANKTCD